MGPRCLFSSPKPSSPSPLQELETKEQQAAREASFNLIPLPPFRSLRPRSSRLPGRPPSTSP